METLDNSIVLSTPGPQYVLRFSIQTTYMQGNDQKKLDIIYGCTLREHTLMMSKIRNAQVKSPLNEFFFLNFLTMIFFSLHCCEFGYNHFSLQNHILFQKNGIPQGPPVSSHTIGQFAILIAYFCPLNVPIILKEFYDQEVIVCTRSHLEA